MVTKTAIDPESGAIFVTGKIWSVNNRDAGSIFRLEPTKLAHLVSQSERGQGHTIQVDGALGLVYRLESSTNLTNWRVVGELQLTNQPSHFRDPSSEPQEQKFYRALLVP